MSVSLTLYTRRPCPFRDDLVAEREDLAAELTQVDVDSYPKLVDLYGERVPVLLDGAGGLLVEGRLDWVGLGRLRQLVPLVEG